MVWCGVRGGRTRGRSQSRPRLSHHDYARITSVVRFLCAVSTAASRPVHKQPLRNDRGVAAVKKIVFVIHRSEGKRRRAASNPARRHRPARDVAFSPPGRDVVSWRRRAGRCNCRLHAQMSPRSAAPAAAAAPAAVQPESGVAALQIKNTTDAAALGGFPSAPDNKSHWAGGGARTRVAKRTPLEWRWGKRTSHPTRNCHRLPFSLPAAPPPPAPWPAVLSPPSR
ncbi:uncharacterized protein LOC126419460 [Schistocerca serialis cubense]|uniref:uncharacterized protein LOC126419460 n=1 Tax=Schistocerca serialis cubense TaxID=2023355 RepID=UPI00214E5001|nr:uncharacterized protein LOC126419460 [Schistocerca serialis cubense]